MRWMMHSDWRSKGSFDFSEVSAASWRTSCHYAAYWKSQLTKRSNSVLLIISISLKSVVKWLSNSLALSTKTNKTNLIQNFGRLQFKLLLTIDRSVGRPKLLIEVFYQAAYSCQSKIWVLIGYYSRTRESIKSIAKRDSSSESSMEILHSSFLWLSTGDSSPFSFSSFTLHCSTALPVLSQQVQLDKKSVVFVLVHLWGRCTSSCSVNSGHAGRRPKQPTRRSSAYRVQFDTRIAVFSAHIAVNRDSQGSANENLKLRTAEVEVVAAVPLCVHGSVIVLTRERERALTDEL